MSSISHPQHKCNHEENRFKVCAPCGRKIKFGSSKPSEFNITGKLECLIKKYVSENFRLTNSKFPLGICGTCRRVLCDRDKDIPNATRPLPNMPNYEDSTKETRTTSCSCYIWLTARATSHPKVIQGRAHTLNVLSEKNSTNGLTALSVGSELKNHATTASECGRSKLKNPFMAYF
ncbi:uncharacterized protein LOC118747296 [Rhagoletis pomonella]|uniref:uncharacterized protein LOC118740382 n=1 Tax=Rhagoletis pomonella TaxID=28610 RepID=UPI001782B433|nr:uncharacterized protein LOC118740382 [Rhagoletis pomonella]XP_036327793.1 uncharacterized protein LOC118740388 [Rhagoletis pomonella]XP_036335191.1 uncharacterized protein LOC118745700 [Rhagoletis pomonella]XP_036337195.1 uncharacterized protein LOC118747296 [Rhagoletis pomonella]